MSLRLEQTGGRLRAWIKPRDAWKVYIQLFMPVAWLWAVLQPVPQVTVVPGQFHAHPSLLGLLENLVTISHAPLVQVLVVADLLVFGFLLGSRVLGGELLTVDAVSLEIATLVFGFPVKRRVFTNSAVSSLSYQTWNAGRAGKRNGIFLESNGKNRVFAGQIGGVDAQRLLSSMVQVYGFPARK